MPSPNKPADLADVRADEPDMAMRPFADGLRRVLSAPIKEPES
jgi:hypothetical protein